MRLFVPLFVAFTIFFVNCNSAFVGPRSPAHTHHHHDWSLGDAKCTYGQAYWCKNLTAAASCHATQHCIQNVWIHKQLEEDKSSICQTCLEMVKEARDQLESNETQDLIKQVFETECSWLRVKPIVKECDKIADNYIPDLIDTLASQMNPQIVCATAGLCNNVAINKFIKENGDAASISVPKQLNQCDKCHSIGGVLQEKFNAASKDQVLQGFLGICGKLSSLSDACSNTVITYFHDIYNHLKAHLNPEEICLVSGECAINFHQHPEKQVSPFSHLEFKKQNKDDLPCEFCEQLVGHLRDLLVANTTEAEFKKVLEGLCGQSGNFKEQCLSLVDQYYSVAYNFLVSELNGTELCTMMGVCKNGVNGFVAPIVPLLPVQTAEKVARVSVTNGGSSVTVLKSNKQNTEQQDLLSPELMTPEISQLPIELLVPSHNVVYSKQTCVFCEYLLHYLQVAITKPSTEDKIKEVIEKACNKLPSTVNETCREFVENYEPALIALIAQEVDPSTVCPLLKACPSTKAEDVDIFMRQNTKGNEQCPLCLFAVTKLEQMVKDKKTVDNIKTNLDKLCEKLPKDLKEQCDDFVNTYTNELVEMLIADLKPQEVCVYLKLCTDVKPAQQEVLPVSGEDMAGDVETNIIPDNTVNGVNIKDPQLTRDPQCVLCEFVMKEIESLIKDKHNEDEIIHAVHNVCNVMPKSVAKQCNDFVDEYGDTVIQLLIATLEPAEICSMMKLCTNSINQVQVEIFDCAVCEAAIYVMEKILANPSVDHKVEHVLEKTCAALPRKDRKKCQEIVEKYGDIMIDMIAHFADKKAICRNIGLCRSEATKVHLQPKVRAVGMNKCSYGPSHWCENMENAQKCGHGAVKHCQDKVWGPRSKRTSSATSDVIPGSNPCTWGPGHWCQSYENAEKCGTGPISHCQQHVWKAERPKRASTSDVIPGSNPCTWGPGHWCQSYENAEKCGTGPISHCQQHVWKAERPKRQVKSVGGNKCTWGPSHWCASLDNAKECGDGAMKHCQAKVWGAETP